MLPRVDPTSAGTHGEQKSTVWFVRRYEGFSGGHLVHGRYYRHASQHPHWQSKIHFIAPFQTQEQAQPQLQPPEHLSMIDSLWPASPTASRVTADEFIPTKNDALFIAGMDWEFIQSLPLLTDATPRLNLIQGLRHTQPATPLYRFLSQRAIRLCVSRAVADALTATRQVNGPVIVIPNGVELPPPAVVSEKKSGLLIVGYKNPQFAQALSAMLGVAGIAHDLLTTMIPRDDFLARLSRYKTLVCLPLAEEGFYLPPLEAMARGALVITADCGGNRGFCEHKVNCLLADYQPESFYTQIQQALNMDYRTRGAMTDAALATAHQHSIARERDSFYKVLAEVKQLW